MVDCGWKKGLHQGSSPAGRGGWEGELLAVDSEEGKQLGAHTPLKATTEGGRETSPYATAPQPGDGAEGETSVNGSLQLTTQQLPTLAPEEVRQSASMNPTADLCNALQRKTTSSLQQSNMAS